MHYLDAGERERGGGEGLSSGRGVLSSPPLKISLNNKGLTSPLGLFRAHLLVRAFPREEMTAMSLALWRVCVRCVFIRPALQIHRHAQLPTADCTPLTTLHFSISLHFFPLKNPNEKNIQVPSVTSRTGSPPWSRPSPACRRWGGAAHGESNQLTHSLKPPGFNPEPIKRETGFKPLLFQLHNLYRYTTVRFKNELERNITIKLGYANAKIYKCEDDLCPRPACYRAYSSTCPDTPDCLVPGFEDKKMKLVRHVSFVDCPGHDILMATMLNGAAVMDGALLLIAGNESCPQPQTSEHLAAVEIMVGLALFTTLFRSKKHRLMTASMVHVINRVTPGSDNPTSCACSTSSFCRTRSTSCRRTRRRTRWGAVYKLRMQLTLSLKARGFNP